MELDVEAEEALILGVGVERTCARRAMSSFSAALSIARLITCRWCTERLSATRYKPSISYYPKIRTEDNMYLVILASDSREDKYQLADPACRRRWGRDSYGVWDCTRYNPHPPSQFPVKGNEK